MRTRIVASSIVLLLGVLSFSSCRKEFRGICKCKYLSGDKVEFDYSHLTIEQASAKCDTTSQNAEAFAGECHLE